MQDDTTTTVNYYMYSYSVLLTAKQKHGVLKQSLLQIADINQRHT